MPNKKLLIIIGAALCSVAVVCGLVFGFIALNDFHVDVKINGESEITLEYNTAYEEMGATAAYYGKWIHKNGKPLEVATAGAVDTSKVGAYELTYSAQNGKHTASVTRKVNIVDTKAPEITLIGDQKVSITKGNSYEDKGANAKDEYDGELTVTVEGEVDTNTVGDYTLTYKAKDSSGNESSITRTVTVKNKKVSVTVQEAPTVNPGAKTVYLTFDDGPCAYTAKLLDILAKYNVKATFFVTNNNPSYNYLFKRMVDEGHAIGIHTATHNYKQIYASEEAFYNDLYKMQNIIKEQTGVTTMLTRFPGGSSNMVSSFNKGIMTRLTASLTEKGFRYFDWNVTSGDAGETTSTSQVAKNVINGMASHSVSVVLQHDIKNFSVNAVEQILKWGIENGYTFKACDMSSPTCHHGINN